MPYNWQINVASPQLLAGMSFKVRFRKLPSLIWTPFLPNPTSNIFTIPNLDDGTYEVEIITVCANGKLSPPRYHSKSFGAVCCAPVILTSSAQTGGSSGNKILKFNNEVGGILRVWINSPTSGAPDIELGNTESQSVTVTGLFTFFWSFIDTDSFGTALLTKTDGAGGGNTIIFSSGFLGDTSPDNTACQPAENVGGANKMQASGNVDASTVQTTNFNLNSCA